MRQILKKKESDILPVSCRLANVFVNTLSKTSQPELIGYVNT
jgi:predicted RNase H-like nuclease